MGVDQKHIAIYLSHLSDGGIGRVITNLIVEFIQRGIKVDLLISRDGGPHLASLPQDVNVIKLPTSHILWAVPFLASYLRREKPDVMLTERIRTDVSAIRARNLVRASTRIFTGAHINLSFELSDKSSKKQKKHERLCLRYLKKNDGVIAVSNGVADDVVHNFEVPRELIDVIYNPLVTPEISNLASEEVEHPWLVDKSLPVVLGAGRLTAQKNFSLLIRAFSKIQKESPCRLIILGQGEEHDELKQLIQSLGLSGMVDLHGFVGNPYSYMYKSDLFVLSSNWEGLSNVLVEALAVGIPVVSTDCPSGPAEVLGHGLYGALTPVNDIDALARAMNESLGKTHDRAQLQASAQRFDVGICADQYLKVFDL